MSILLDWIEIRFKDYMINPDIPKEALEFMQIRNTRYEMLYSQNSIMKHMKKATSPSDWCLYAYEYDAVIDIFIFILARIKQIPALPTQDPEVMLIYKPNLIENDQQEKINDVK